MAHLMKDRFYVTVDAVVFTILHNELKLLLIRRKNPPFKGQYALPGGFVDVNEDIEQAALRELEEETGVKNIFLKPMKAFGKPGRDPRGRTITMPYIALINSERYVLKSADDAELARWFSVYELPELAFDHRAIIETALEKLKRLIQYTSIAFQIMPEKFTLTELQKAYEVVLDQKLDKRNFRKKIEELRLLKPLNETRMEGAHRPAQLYCFRERKYRPLS